MQKIRNYNTEEAFNMLAANQAVLDVIPEHLKKMKNELAVALVKYLPAHSKLGKNVREICDIDFLFDEYFLNSIEGKGDVYQEVSLDEEYPVYTFLVQALARDEDSHDILFPFEIELVVKPFTFLRREEVELEWGYESLCEQYGIDDANNDDLKDQKIIIDLMHSINSLFAELQNLHSSRKNNENYVPEIRSRLSTLGSELNWLDKELETKLEKLI